MSCCKKFKDEFRCKNFIFGYDYPRKFVTSECGPRILYPIWTCFWLLYHIGWLCYELYTRIEYPENRLPFLLFLTNWSYVVLVVTNLTDVICTVYTHCRREDIYMLTEDDTIPTPWYLQISWLLFEISNTSAITITVLFYTLLTPNNSPISLEYHALNSVYVILNFFVCAKPVRIFHMIYPMIYGTIYTLFSVIHQLVGKNDPVYNILDWSKPDKSIVYVLILVFVVVPIIHMMFYGFYHLRVLLRKAVCKSS